MQEEINVELGEIFKVEELTLARSLYYKFKSREAKLKSLEQNVVEPALGRITVQLGGVVLPDELAEALLNAMEILDGKDC